MYKQYVFCQIEVLNIANIKIHLYQGNNIFKTYTRISLVLLYILAQLTRP